MKSVLVGWPAINARSRRPLADALEPLQPTRVLSPSNPGNGCAPRPGFHLFDLYLRRSASSRSFLKDSDMRHFDLELSSSQIKNIRRGSICREANAARAWRRVTCPEMDVTSR